MSGYTKLFSSIVTSSIWGEDGPTRLVWITMMALANKDGLVEAAIPGLANAARVTLEECELAIAKFEAPDKYSRTVENEGRRVKRVDGGYQLLNYQIYRKKLSVEDRREYQRIKQGEYRQKKSENGESNPVPKKRFTAPTLPEVKLAAAKSGMAESDAERFWNYYESNGWVVGKARSPMKKWVSALANWQKNNFSTQAQQSADITDLDAIARQAL